MAAFSAVPCNGAGNTSASDGMEIDWGEPIAREDGLFQASRAPAWRQDIHDLDYLILIMPSTDHHLRHRLILWWRSRYNKKRKTLLAGFLTQHHTPVEILWNQLHLS